MLSEEKIRQYLANAYAIARQSRDMSNQTGAVIASTDTGELITTGVNNFPPGVRWTIVRAGERPAKYRYFEHAERMAVYQAARAGKLLYGSTMICPWASCCPCARAMICSGIKHLVMHHARMQMTPTRWIDDMNEALTLLEEAGVKLSYFKGPIAAPSFLVNGELWDPSEPPVVENGNWFVGMDGAAV